MICNHSASYQVMATCRDCCPLLLSQISFATDINSKGFDSQAPADKSLKIFDLFSSNVSFQIYLYYTFMFPLKCQKLGELKTTSAIPELLYFHIIQGWKEFSILINWRIKISIQLRCRVSLFSCGIKCPTKSRHLSWKCRLT